MDGQDTSLLDSADLPTTTLISMYFSESRNTSNVVANDPTAVRPVRLGMHISKRSDTSVSGNAYDLRIRFAMNAYGEPDVGNLLVRFDED